MLRQRKGLRLASLLLAIALVAAACGGGGGETGAGTDEPTNGADADAGGEGDGDGDTADGSDGSATFVYAAAGVPEQLDVWSAYEGDPSRVQMYEWGSKLVWYDTEGLEEHGCRELATTENLRPGLAESWERDDDGNLVFTLRQGVLSPAGNEMTSDDVVWSLDRAAELSGIVQFLMSDVASFAEENTYEAIDEYTIRVNVAEPTALDFSVFTYPMFQVLDSTVAMENAGEGEQFAEEWLKTNHVDFGPWQLESFEPGSEAVYTLNPNYWDAERLGNVDRLVIRNVAESSTRLQLVSTGEADYAERLSFQEYAELEGGGDADVLDCVSPNRDTLLTNQQFEAFSDVDVRRAISMAIDREALVEGVYQGFARPSTTGMGNVYLEQEGDALTFEHDPEQAQQLLQDAGVTDLAFTITASPTRPGAHAESLAVQIQSMLSDLGVNAEVNVVAGSTEFSDQFFNGNYESMIYLEPPALADPFYSANLYNTTVSFQNTFGFDNQQYDDLAQQIKTTPPGEERQELIAEISDLIVETVPQVYLVERSYIRAFSNAVSGYQNTPHGSVLTFQMTKE